ncbi:MAG: four-carbon acid sugar kinase family protein [Nitrososphaeria archaeon]
MGVNIFDSVLIIADDFTGANDTAAQFAKLGWKTLTTLDLERVERLLRCYDVVAVDTETRHKTAEEAHACLVRLGSKIKTYFDKVLIYKKVDSTLRGNIAYEIKGLFESLDPDLVVFAPAYPKQGRTTRECIQLLNNVPVAETYFGDDIRTPVKSSKLSDCFELEYKTLYYHVSIEELRSEKVFEILRNRRFVSFDAESEDDLKFIAQLSNKLVDLKTIWVGSAGLAEHLAYNILIGERKGRPVLMVVGSVNKVVREQIRTFCTQFEPFIVEIDINLLINDFEREAERLIGDVKEALTLSADIILTTSYSNKQIFEGRVVANSLGLDMLNFGSIIADKVGKVVSLIIENLGWQSFSGLFMTGGDIAMSVIKNLQISSLEVVGEVEPGLPILKYKKYYLVTKAGGFGSSETLIKITSRLKSMVESIEP